MVGLVLVSHSATLAAGVVELAREMGGPDVAIEPAGGMADPPGAVGTDAELVMAAIGRADGGDGVLVLMDLGSAIMSAELAVEMGDPGARVQLAAAPLVEGAVAAAASARTGADLETVAAEARGALAAKQDQLGETTPPPPPGDVTETGEADDGDELRVAVSNRLGLHARPVARIVAVAAAHDATLTLRNVTTGAGPAAATSMTALAGLGARRGHELLARASGPGAMAALAELETLAADGFGDGADDAAAVAAAQPSATAAAVQAAPAPAAPPAPGTTLTGLAASAGIAIGPARPLVAAAIAVDDSPAGDPTAEVARLDAALDAARAEIAAARSDTARRAGEESAAIFDAHLLLLADAAILDPARAAIAGGTAAPRAYRDAADGAAALFAGLDDPLLRERAADVDDVAVRVLAALAGGASPAPPAIAPGVLIADDLTPGQTAALDRDAVLAIATARGSLTAHAAILARAFGIPAVLGLGPSVLAIADGTRLALDGAAGELLVDPGAEELARRERRREQQAARAAVALAHAAEPALTSDGTRIEVAANLGSPDEVAAAIANGAEGVGLLRSEFLFLGRDELPGEDEQAEVYAAIADALGGRPLIVRTLDVGADKPLPGVAQEPEANPFLGERGLRLGLARPELLRVQLRAVVRAAQGRALRVMFPMVSTAAELVAARAILAEVAGELTPPPVGIMVEVPAAALQASRLAAHVDFFSIGTNDLAQYVMAAERGNPALAPLLEGPLPALLALVAEVTAAADAAGIWVGVCGELAGDPAAAALLVGLGVRELSMAAPLIPAAKQALRGLDLAAARAAAKAAIGDDDAASARARGARLLADALG